MPTIYKRQDPPRVQCHWCGVGLEWSYRRRAWQAGIRLHFSDTIEGIGREPVLWSFLCPQAPFFPHDHVPG